MNRQTKGRILLGAALLCSLVIYARTLHFDFVYDDGNQIVRNTHLQSATFIPVYFKADVWSQYHTAGQGRYYRPFFLIWLLMNRELFGLSPVGWHATSVLLELLAIFLLYAVCSKLLNDPLGGGIAALLFAVHPANIESVAWVSSSSELLMGVLLLSAFLLYLRFRDSDRSMDLALSAVLFAIALGCKETAIAFLPILMWHEWCCPSTTDGIEKVQVPGKTPTSPSVRLALYGFVALFYVVIRTTVLGGYGLGVQHAVTIAEAILTIPSAILFYLRHLFFPISLSVFYDLPYTRTLFSAQFGLSSLIVLCVTGLLWALSRRVSMGRASLGWIFLPLVPPLAGLRAFTQGDLVHDRYLYLSTMGLAMLAAALLVNVAEKSWGLRIRQILPSVVAGAFLFLSLIQLGYWKNNLTLYQRSTEVSPHSILAFDTLANELFRRNDFAGAVSTYEKSLAVDPNSWTTNMALGITLTATHEDARAIPYYKGAIELDPTYTDEYMMLIRAQEHEKLYADAEQTVIRGLAAADNLPQLHFELGSLLERRGDFAGARAQYERTLALNPWLQEATTHLSTLPQVKTRP